MSAKSYDGVAFVEAQYPFLAGLEETPRKTVSLEGPGFGHVPNLPSCSGSMSHTTPGLRDCGHGLGNNETNVRLCGFVSKSGNVPSCNSKEPTRTKKGHTCMGAQLN